MLYSLLKSRWVVRILGVTFLALSLWSLRTTGYSMLSAVLLAAGIMWVFKEFDWEEDDLKKNNTQ